MGEDLLGIVPGHWRSIVRRSGVGSSPTSAANGAIKSACQSLMINRRPSSSRAKSVVQIGLPRSRNIHWRVYPNYRFLLGSVRCSNDGISLVPGQGCSTLKALISQNSIEAECVVIQPEADVFHAVKAEEIKGKRAQLCENAGMTADSAGVFIESCVPDVVKPILDGPMGADHLIQLRCGKLLVAQVISRLLGACPLFKLGAETFRLAVHPDQGLKVIMLRLSATA